MNSHYLIPNWFASDRVKAYSTTRHGGHSLPPFDTLNLGLHVGDDASHVEANRRQLIQDLNLPAAPIWLNQIHGCEVAILEKQPSTILSVDAAVTREKNIVCAVMTADCLPVLLCDQAGTQVAAIHAGWRGLASGIILETLKKMEYNQQNEIMAWLGPAIGPTAFEIDETVKIALSDLLPAQDSEACFKPLQSNDNQSIKYLADLYKIATYQLLSRGVKNITGGEYCTYSQPERFFSYRRTSNSHPGPVLTGRMASLIWLT